MYKNILKLCIFTVVAGCFFVAASPVFAEHTISSVYLDTATMEKGYTVTDGNFQIGVPPHVFSEGAYVKIKGLEAGEIPPSPEGKTLISPIYVYDVRVQDPHFLTQPLYVSLDFSSTTQFRKKIHFFNRVTNAWQAIPSEVDEKTGKMRAAIHFPYSIIAVFESDGILDIPVIKDDASWSWYDSASYATIDNRTGTTLYEHSGDETRPIASLTKIMTALILLEHNIDFDTVVTYDGSCERAGARLRMSPGETIRTRDLWFAMLTGSANNATVCILQAADLSEDEAVALMNDKATELGLTHTHFEEVTGLSENNVSTANEYALLARESLKWFPVLEATTIPEYGFTTINYGIPHTLHNTNKPVFNLEYAITGVKTGFTYEAFYCQMIRAKNEAGDQIIAVVLGNPSWQDRYDEAKQLVREAFDNTLWP